jgi:hypothetical protein
METIPPDFREWPALLNETEVEYLVVGGYALAQHGAPRFTGDLDVYTRPSQGNARRVAECLDAFGFGSLGLSPSDFQEPGVVVQLGVPPVRINLVTSVDGVSWEEAEANCQLGSLGGVDTRFIGRREFIQTKRASGRPQDLADIAALEQDS